MADDASKAAAQQADQISTALSSHVWKVLESTMAEPTLLQAVTAAVLAVHNCKAKPMKDVAGQCVELFVCLHSCWAPHQHCRASTAGLGGN